MTDSRCIIHIGAPKTGSTLIQRVLFENRDTLERRAFKYPDVSLRGYGHHDLAFLIGGGYPEWATPQPRSLGELAEDLRAAISGYTGSLIFSSEDFYLCPNPIGLKSFLAKTGALDGRTISIVVYVRRQDEAHESWYNQTIKAQGYTHTVDRCLEEFHDLFDYQKQLARWADAFGIASMVVRPYETKAYAGGTLLADFISTLGVPLEELHVSSDRVNTSLNADILEFQRAVNALPLTVQEKRKFHRQLIDLSAATKGSGLFNESSAIDGDTRSAILASYADGNAEVARKYLGRNVLFEELSQKNRDSGAMPGLTSEKLAAILGWLITKGS